MRIANSLSLFFHFSTPCKNNKGSLSLADCFEVRHTKRALNDYGFSLPNFRILPLIRELRESLVLFLVHVYFAARIVTVCSLQVNDWLDEILYLNGICNQLKDFLRIFVSHRTLIDGSCTNRG